MPDIDIQALRETVVDSLMTNGWGEVAWRLQLRGKRAADVHVAGAKETDLGGRNRASVTGCIQPLVDAAIAKQVELDADREAHAKTRAALAEFVRWHGPAHEEGCSEDDTCDCAAKPANDAVNGVLRGYPLASDNALQRADRAEAELAAIDAMLARRSALDGCTTRVERVQRCIDAAAVTDPGELTAKLIEARKEAGKWRSDYDRAEAIVRGLRKWLQHETNRRLVRGSRNANFDAMLAKLDELEAQR